MKRFFLTPAAETDLHDIHDVLRDIPHQLSGQPFRNRFFLTAKTSDSIVVLT